MTFSTVKVGVMGYQNLSYCIRKPPRKVSGPKKFFEPGPEAIEVGPAENLSALKSGVISDGKSLLYLGRSVDLSVFRTRFTLIKLMVLSI